LLEGVKD